MRRIFALFLMMLALISITAPVLACEPPPTKPPTSKYTNCDDLGSGYQLGFGVTGASNGTYRLIDRDGTMIGGAPEDPQNSVKIYGSNARTFDWQSSLGIDAVIVHAGGTSTVKKMNERTSGQDFYGKLGSDRKPYKIDGISFCYDYELSVSTSVQGTSTGAGSWEITKTVDTPVQSKFAGETADFLYTVAVNGTAGSATAFQVNTEVTIKNNTPVKASIREIKDYLTAWKKWVRLDCGNIRLPYTLKPGRELKCSASTAVTSKRSGQNMVRVTANGVGSGSAEADIEWSGGSTGADAPIGAVTVTDTNEAFGGPYSVSASKSWTYTVSLACPTDPDAYENGVYKTTLDNTAAILETSLQDSQSVELTCYAPVTSVTSASTYDAAYEWGITKTSPVTNLTMKQDATAKVGYTVIVSVIDRVESNFKISGAIRLSNPNPTAAMTVSLLDETTQGTPAALKDCANPLTIPAGESVTCQYNAAFATKLEQGGTVQVSLNNIVFSDLQTYDFTGAVVSETDECVRVLDDAFSDPLGTACADEAPAEYQYEIPVGPFPNCFDTDYTNTAYFITNDTEASKFANWQVLINVLCEQLTNCTYNATYWIAHANPDPSTYDATWDAIPGGPGASFFETGGTWLSVLTDDPGTSLYYGLGREYIVGRLNVLRGAQASAQFHATLDHAADLLAAYDKAQDTITDEAVVNDFRDTRLSIDNFNSGFTGPGICPDCTTE